MFGNFRECYRVFLALLKPSESYRTFQNSINPSGEQSQKSEKYFEGEPSMDTATHMCQKRQQCQRCDLMSGLKSESIFYIVQQNQKSEKYFERELSMVAAIHKGQKSQKCQKCDLLSGLKSASIPHIVQQSQKSEKYFERDLSMDTATHKGQKSQQCWKFDYRV